jgi:sugar lactone lactonase YvrE
VNELIRARMHEALDVAPPTGLRARVIDAALIDARALPRGREIKFRWAAQGVAGLVAALLAIALIAALLYSRGALGPLKPSPGHPASPVRLIAPEGIAIAPDGTVYVSDYVGGRVFRLDARGKLVSIAGGGVSGDGPASQASLYYPAGIAVDSNGDVYLADTLGGSVRRIDRSGNLSTVAIILGAQAVVISSGGTMYISGWYGEIRSIDSNGNRAFVDMSSLRAPALKPGYMAFDRSGNLYIADRAPSTDVTGVFTNPNGGCRIVRVSTDQKVSVVAGTGVCGFSGDGGLATSAQLDDPHGLAFDGAGNLYVADANNHRIRRIDTHGIITTVVGIGVAGHAGDGGAAAKAELDYPFGLGIKSDELLYISDAGCECVDPTITGRLRVVNLSDGSIATATNARS